VLLQLRDACEQRHIVLGLPLYDAPTTHVGSAKMDRDGTMHWPCMFLYDEYGTSDFVAQFCELHTFRQQLEVSAGCPVRVAKVRWVVVDLGSWLRPQVVLPDAGAPAPWDVDGAYRVSNVDVYYVERATQALPKELTFLSEGDRRLLDLTVRRMLEASGLWPRAATAYLSVRVRWCLCRAGGCGG